MKRFPDLTELYRHKDAHRKTEAKRAVPENFVPVSQLRGAERTVASARAANRTRRAIRRIKFRLKTA